jgi:DNA-directed RNA polymerase specialized sigma24 family protein
MVSAEDHHATGCNMLSRMETAAILDDALFAHASECSTCWKQFLHCLDEEAAELPESPPVMPAMQGLVAAAELHEVVESWMSALSPLASDVDDLTLPELLAAPPRPSYRGIMLVGSGVTLLPPPRLESPAFPREDHHPGFDLVLTLNAGNAVQVHAMKCCAARRYPKPLLAPPRAEVRAEFLDDAFWKTETPRFELVAQQVLDRVRWGRTIDVRGKDAPDYVVEAALSILSGEQQCPDGMSPTQFVCGVIKTLIVNDRRARMRKTGLPLFWAAPHGVEAPDERVEARDLANAFLMKLPDEQRRYVELRLSDTCGTAKDYARALGVEVRDVCRIDRGIRELRPLWDAAPAKTSSIPQEN